MNFPWTPGETMACLRRGALAAFALYATATAWGDYRPPDQRTIYDDMMQEVRDRPKRSWAPVPTPAPRRETSQRSTYTPPETMEQRQLRMWANYRESPADERARNEALAADYARLAALGEMARRGDLASMRRYGLELLTRPTSSARTKETGVEWMRAAAARGDAEAQQWRLAHDPTADEERKFAAIQAASQALLARARAGDVSAMREFGFGIVYSPDPTQSKSGRDWIKKAADQGDEPALAFLVETTRGEMGTPAELAEALEWRVQLARFTKHEEICYQLGEIFLTGRFGAKIDRATSVRYFEKAAAGTWPSDALFRIAKDYAVGLSGPRDVAEGLRRYQIALAALPSKLTTRDEVERDEAVIMVTLLKLEPESDPAAHATELLALVDQQILVPDDFRRNPDNLSRQAADTLASGRMGIVDRDRELYYFSRAIRYGRWSQMPEHNFDEAAAAFAESLTQRVAESSAPLYLVEQKTERIKYASGNELNEERYYRVEQTKPKMLNLLLEILDKVTTTESRAYRACGRFALMMSEAELSEANRKPMFAFGCFDAAARGHDDPVAWLESGKLLLRGAGQPSDPVGAQVRLLKAWEKGQVGAALPLAAIHQRHLVPEATEQQAFAWIQRGAEKGDPACMAHWGNHLYSEANNSKVATEATQAQSAEGRRWLERASEAGDAGAFADLAEIYLNGVGVPLDQIRGMELLKRAVEMDSGKGKRLLAQALAEGKGVDKDQKRAMALMHEAALVDLTAANNFGVVLWRGDWGEKDVENGLKWMEVALGAGNWQTGRNLAKIHHLGLGVPADESKARAYLEQAGAMGGAESASNVAGFYAGGEIITKDLAAAQRWRSVATTADPLR